MKNKTIVKYKLHKKGSRGDIYLPLRYLQKLVPIDDTIHIDHKGLLAIPLAYPSTPWESTYHPPQPLVTPLKPYAIQLQKVEVMAQMIQ